MPRKLDSTADPLLARRERLEQLARSLAAEDWQFNACPDEELACCCYYEYAREIDGVKTEVSQLRASKFRSDGLYPGDAQYFIQHWFNTFFRGLPEFPDVPWLKIDPSKRREVCPPASRSRDRSFRLDQKD